MKGRRIQSLKSFLSSRNLQSTDVFGRRYTLEDQIARILKDLRQKAECQFGLSIRSGGRFILWEQRTGKMTFMRRVDFDRGRVGGATYPQNCNANDVSGDIRKLGLLRRDPLPTLRNPGPGTSL